MNYRFDKAQVLEHLTDEILLEVLSEYNITPFKTKPNEFWFTTFCHGGDSHKLCYYRDSKYFYCYTSCGSMSVFSVLMSLMHCSFSELLKHLAQKENLTFNSHKHGFGIDDTTLDTGYLDRYLNIIRKTNQKADINVNIDHPEICENVNIDHSKLCDFVKNSHITDLFDKDVYYEEWLREGISPQTMRLFGIGWYAKERSVAIPHYNIEHALIGIRRRATTADDIAKGKYKPLTIQGITYAHPLGKNLYGIEHVCTAVTRLHRIIIAEGEKSVLHSYDFYGENSITVAVCGSNITNTQRDMVLSLGVSEVVIAFDNDHTYLQYLEDHNKEYEEYTEHLVRLAKKFTPYCRTYVLWDRVGLLDQKDSPFDKGKDVFEQLMRNKIEITDEILEQYNA